MSDTFPPSAPLTSAGTLLLRCGSSPDRAATVLSQRAWVDEVVRKCGMHCDAVDGRLRGAVVKAWALGNVAVMDVSIGHCAVTPVRNARANSPEEILLLKLFLEGGATFRQSGSTAHFASGSIAILDPKEDFVETFRDTARVSVFRFPKSLLRRRGYPFNTKHIVAPDMTSPEAMIVRDMLTSIIARSAGIDYAFAARLEQQIVDMMDVLMPGASASTDESYATLHRAKQFMRRNLGDAELDACSIGKAMRLSVSYLNRLFRRENTSLMRHLWTMRLDRADSLLRDRTLWRIDQVAFHCGFSSAAHFSRTYRERYGVSPRETRERVARGL